MNSKLYSLLIFTGSILIIALSYFVGVFTTSFDNNLCYSDVIDSVRSKTIKVIKENDQNEIKKLELTLSNLPLRGYESNCKEIKSAVEK